MLGHRRTSSRSLSVGQEAAVARITLGVTAALKALDHVGRRTQQVTSRSLNARDELILSRAFSLEHHRNLWISALLIQSPNLALRRYKEAPSCGNRARVAKRQYRKIISRDSSTLLGTTDAEFGISVLLSMKAFAACANFRPLCFVPQSRDFWSAHASSRRFWGRRPLIEKRCEDASHSQSTSCKMPWTHSDPSISV